MAALDLSDAAVLHEDTEGPERANSFVSLENTCRLHAAVQSL